MIKAINCNIILNAFGQQVEFRIFSCVSFKSAGKKLVQKNLKESRFFPDIVYLNIFSSWRYVKGLVNYAFYFSGLLQFNKLTRFFGRKLRKRLGICSNA